MRNVQVNIRFTEAEKGKLARRAKQSGITLSEYIRLIALNYIVALKEKDK